MEPISPFPLARWHDSTLTLQNAHFHETWRADVGGQLRLISFHRSGGPEWVSTQTPARPLPNADPLSCPALLPEDDVAWPATFGTQHPDHATAATGLLVVELRFVSPTGNRWRRHEFQLHPAVAGAVHRITGPETDAALREFALPPNLAADLSLVGRLKTKPNGQMFATLPAIAQPLFGLARRHLRVRDVQLTDQTDHHSNLVFEREWLTHPGERCLPLQTNLLCIEDPATKEADGFLWLLLAPLHHVRAGWSPYFDFLLAFQSGQLVATACPAGYALARVAYSGGRTGATSALHALQRAFYQAEPHRPGMLLSNTWGDRAGAAHLSEAFVLEEIAAASALGVEVVQIDDGWQKGTTVNTVTTGGVWNGFWATDPSFWQPHPLRFPRGLTPLVRAAETAGVHIGLWYAPDSSDDLGNWEKDAAQILTLWTDNGIAHFKLDALKLHSRLAETRFHALCDRVLSESKGAIFFDFDATAENRPTFWGRQGAGSLFLENRFTEQAGYHPHQTLRSLWSLAHYIRPERIRAEFLNPARNNADYADDPLRPAAYPPEYLFAITLPTSPLAWFEVSRVPPAIAACWRPLIALWKQHRAAFQAGTVLPIGQAPDGFSWTGFFSHRTAVETGGVAPACYALIFRELTDEDTQRIPLPSTLELDIAGEGQLLAGHGRVSIDASHRLVVHIPSSQHFLFACWTRP